MLSGLGVFSRCSSPGCLAVCLVVSCCVSGNQTLVVCLAAPGPEFRGRLRGADPATHRLHTVCPVRCFTIMHKCKIAQIQKHTNTQLQKHTNTKLQTNTNRFHHPSPPHCLVFIAQMHKSTLQKCTWGGWGGGAHIQRRSHVLYLTVDVPMP